MPPRARVSPSKSVDRSTEAEAARADGASSTNRSCTWAKKSWYRTWPDGVASECPSSPDTAYFTLAPDWVCEVLSASTRKVDLQRKRPIYAGAGVPHLWLIDPVDRTLEAFELLDGQWLLIASAQDDAPVSIRPFDAITFSLGELWD